MITSLMTTVSFTADAALGTFVLTLCNALAMSQSSNTAEAGEVKHFIHSPYDGTKFACYIAMDEQSTASHSAGEKVSSKARGHVGDGSM